MGLPPRTNLVRVPVARLRAVIEADPVVARAEVRRIPPGTLRVTVEERKPRILLKAGGSHFTLDRGFVPFRKPMVSDASLPVLALESIRPTRFAGANKSFSASGTPSIRV
jgi:cell division septal protein FtsQ